MGEDASFLGCVVHIWLGLQFTTAEQQICCVLECLGVCTDGSSPDDLFRLGVDVQGLDAFHIVTARVSSVSLVYVYVLKGHVCMTVVKYTNSKQIHCVVFVLF